MCSRASRAPPSGCRWGPAGYPGRSGESTQGTGPTPRTAPSGWCTAGRSRWGLSRLRWSLLLCYLRTGWLRSGHLYLHTERHAGSGSEKRTLLVVCCLMERAEDRSSCNADTYGSIFHVLLREYWSVCKVQNNAGASWRPGVLQLPVWTQSSLLFIKCTRCRNRIYS